MGGAGAYFLIQRGAYRNKGWEPLHYGITKKIIFVYELGHGILVMALHLETDGLLLVSPSRFFYIHSCQLHPRALVGFELYRVRSGPG